MVDNAFAIESSQKRRFTIQVLGRTLEHLGKQMYKRRDVAIVELVANCWDAGATEVSITLPDPTNYDPTRSSYIISDNGSGMNDDEVQDHYLVVGRNRRRVGGLEHNGRKVMGRKGVGKLAGFGIADTILLETWQGNSVTTLALEVDQLKKDDGESGSIDIIGSVGNEPDAAWGPSGTRIVLQSLKHKTPLSKSDLCEALARRFSRVVRGKMRILVNGEELAPPSLDLVVRVPEKEGEWAEHELANGDIIRYSYGFSERSIAPVVMRGFSIYVHEKTAQTPPFFFNVEASASGQHSTRYITGEIHADFLDDNTDDDSDVISTDRQEIDWESERVQQFRVWGEELSRRLLREWAGRKAARLKESVERDPDLSDRIERLEKSTQTKLWSLIDKLAGADADPDKAVALVDPLIRAFEYRHFHDLIEQIELAAESDPVQLALLLDHLQDWKVLESRAILEIVKGRLEIIEKFHSMLVSNAPETSNRAPNSDNMHDLIASYPWLLDPEWQVLDEEKSITRRLREWGLADVDAGRNTQDRYDFLALSSESLLVIIDIKRSGHAVSLAELQRLEGYRERLSLATNKEIFMLMVCNGWQGLSAQTLANWQDRPDGDIRRWSDIHDRTRKYYEHYRAVLESDVSSVHFANKTREVLQTRKIASTGAAYRSPADRAIGLGPQDSLPAQAAKSESDPSNA